MASKVTLAENPALFGPPPPPPHAPHHHITQLNAAKGLVGNPLELFLVSLSVIALFDFQKNAVFGAFNVLTAVSAFAHANVRFDPPRWYSYVFTTVEAHSLHHSVGYNETRCNYANVLLLWDRVFGTFREGESRNRGPGRTQETIDPATVHVPCPAFDGDDPSEAEQLGVGRRLKSEDGPDTHARSM